jgi:hypothetical protein
MLIKPAQTLRDCYAWSMPQQKAISQNLMLRKLKHANRKLLAFYNNVVFISTWIAQYVNAQRPLFSINSFQRRVALFMAKPIMAGWKLLGEPQHKARFRASI